MSEHFNEFITWYVKFTLFWVKQPVRLIKRSIQKQKYKKVLHIVGGKEETNIFPPPDHYELRSGDFNDFYFADIIGIRWLQYRHLYMYSFICKDNLINYPKISAEDLFVHLLSYFHSSGHCSVKSPFKFHTNFTKLFALNRIKCC